MARADDRRAVKAAAKQRQYQRTKFQQGVIHDDPYWPRGKVYPYASVKRLPAPAATGKVGVA